MSRSFASAVPLAGFVLVQLACDNSSKNEVAANESAVCVSETDPGPAFARYVSATGGVAGAGKPITGVFDAPSSDGRTYPTQCFERRVLELHPENDCNSRVQGRLLGKDRFAELYGDSPPPSVSRGAPIDGSPTSFGVSDAVLRHWRDTGGLAENGWPISDYFYEESELEPGKTFVVQYFERAVFELHPENDAPYDVLGKQLGTLSSLCKGRAPAPSALLRFAAFIPGPKPGTSAPACARVNFANVGPGGLLGGIFQTDERDFSWDRAMNQSKVAAEVRFALDGVADDGFRKYATRTCRYDHDGGIVFPDGHDDWCRYADYAAPVECKDADRNGITYDDQGIVAHNPDGRVGRRVAIRFHVSDPLSIASTLGPIHAQCTLDVFFDRNGAPVDLWAECDHPAFPSYELYVDGTPVMLHSGFSHSPGDLATPTLPLHSRHHCPRDSGAWRCINE